MNGKKIFLIIRFAPLSGISFLFRISAIPVNKIKILEMIMEIFCIRATSPERFNPNPKKPIKNPMRVYDVNRPKLYTTLVSNFDSRMIFNIPTNGPHIVIQ